MLKYDYLYNEQNELIPVEKATTGNYRMYPDDPLDYVFKNEFTKDDGTFVRGHFSLKSNNFLTLDFAIIGGGGESPEHYNEKMKIVNEKKYYDSIFKKWVYFDNVIAEKKQDNKKPDLSCFVNNQLVCCIEIYSSNRKSEKDIKELRKINVPIIEIDINNGNECKHLILPTLLEVQQREYTEINSKIYQAEQRYRELANELQPEFAGVEKSIKEFRNRAQHEFRIAEGKFQNRFKKISDWLHQRETNGRNNRLEVKKLSNEIYKSEYRIEKIREHIERLEIEIGNYCDYENHIKNEIGEIERKFVEVVKNCKIEWFSPNGIALKNVVKLSQAKYWTT